MTTGATTERSVRIRPAPSTWAASSISTGTSARKRAQHPDRDRQVHRGVEDDQQPDVVEQSDRLREQVERQQAGDDRQHLGGQEEEQHVGPLRTGWIDSAYAAGKASRSTRTVDSTLAVSEFSSGGQGPRVEEGPVALQGQRGERRAGGFFAASASRVERREHHPQHRQHEQDADDPGQPRSGTSRRCAAACDGWPRARACRVTGVRGGWRWRSSGSPPGTAWTRSAARTSR